MNSLLTRLLPVGRPVALGTAAPRGRVLYSTRLADPELERIETVPLQATRLAGEPARAGAQPAAPVVILHGLFGSRRNNRRLAQLLNGRLGRDVYTLDLRNHGASPRTPRHDYPAMVADVARWLRENTGRAAPVLVGHSMGAKVAMGLALRQPHLCSALVSIENAPVATVPEPEFPRYIGALERLAAQPELSAAQAQRALAAVESDPDVRLFLLSLMEHYRDPASGKLRYRPRIPLRTLKDAVVRGAIAGWELSPATHRYTGPALFLRGTRSNYVADDYLPAVGSYFPNFDVRDVAGGHWINSQQPQLCADLIVDFLGRRDL
ncbi:ACL180Cp [Eremothecium gossypii ATCC 10895]|uniref:ACL180Cp n=1 Tax=Eremothecium gossypii (strain ATCC 10895 / CBS 109.51 / FGSC 9923 / NRRL Y-1056) TaxID=284811 RepID=Q75CU9_EREGS|nr:ACL180Cp [Eremothecium gossypii ATCC 10895]AAS51048.2 ACL180Cp [Eremothecium gossypii ATCC 10895]AEY95338.1 FACL180Cp [Eremothecium gossypii FDAG1]